MIGFRRALLVVGAMLAAAPGCRTAGVGGLTRPTPPPERPALATSNIIAQINRNARLVHSIKAEPSIRVVQGNRSYGVSGRMALERPRNFRLTLNSPMHKEADLGSNEEEFWFWTRQAEPREYYVCRYDRSGSSPLAVAFQPDWIIEALGLRPIPSEEAAGITVERRGSASTLALTQHRKLAGGQTYTKVTIVDAEQGLILEQQLYEGDKKTLLARAVIVDGKYRRYNLPADGPEGGGTVVLPLKVKLQWAREQLTLIVDLNEPELNASFGPELFEEPQASFKGYARRDISEAAGLAGSPTTVRETRPAPPAGTGVHLDEPEPLAPDASSRRDLGGPLSWDERADSPDQLVRVRQPSAPETDFLRAQRSGWVQARHQPLQTWMD